MIPARTACQCGACPECDDLASLGELDRAYERLRRQSRGPHSLAIDEQMERLGEVRLDLALQIEARRMKRRIG